MHTIAVTLNIKIGDRRSMHNVNIISDSYGNVRIREQIARGHKRGWVQGWGRLGEVLRTFPRGGCGSVRHDFQASTLEG